MNTQRCQRGRPVWLLLCVLLAMASCGGDSTTDPASDADALDVAGTDVPTPTCPLVETFDLGWVDVDAATGLSEVLTVAIPDDVLSVLVVLEGAPSATYAVTHLVDSEGTVLIADDWLATATGPVCLACANRIAASRQTHAALIPNAPNVVPVGGDWHFQFLSFSDSDGTPLDQGAQVAVVVKRGSGLPTSGTLQLQWLVPADLEGVGPDNRAEMLTPITSQLAEVFAQAGVSLATPHVTPVDWPADWTLDALLQNGHTLPEVVDGAVRVLLVDSLLVGTNPLAGFAPVPGTQPVGAGVGVTLQLSDPGLNGPALGASLAHELGHYLGLWHTREAGEQGVLDPLPDTPAVSKDNLMTVDLLGDVLTPSQAEVMRRHPAITHACSP